MTIERAAPKPGERILDVGCGCGTTTLKLANLLAPGGDITALDVSTLMLAIAREKTKTVRVTYMLFNHPRAKKPKRQIPVGADIDQCQQHH